MEQVYAAKTDAEAADHLIRQYMGFIRAETAKYLHRAPVEGQDEEFSIVLLAFYEAILGYEKNRGAFLSYASRGIRNRLIDYYRKERKHAKVTSLHEPVQEDDGDTMKIDQLEHPENDIEKSHRQSATKERSWNLRRSFRNSASHFQMWLIIVRARSVHSKRAAGCWLRRGNIRSILTNFSGQKKLPIAGLAEISKTDKRRWNGTGNIW